MAETKIEWTMPPWVKRGMTWNPIYGCTPIAAGCKNCYAARLAHRFNAKGPEVYRGLTSKAPNGSISFNGQINYASHRLLDPLAWKDPCGVFVTSMSDPFHGSVIDYYVDEMFAVMAATQQHTYFLLTKRADYAAHYLSNNRRADAVRAHLENTLEKEVPLPGWPLPNVWLIYSASNQRDLEYGIEDLLRTPAAKSGLSLEPLIGQIDLEEAGALGVDWVIVGAESGPGARLMKMEWVEHIETQCAGANIPLFFKQAKGEDGKMISLPWGDAGAKWPERGY